MSVVKAIESRTGRIQQSRIGTPFTASVPLTVASTPISEPTEMSMLPEMMTIDMPMAATAI
jgi:hypothetical protein